MKLPGINYNTQVQSLGREDSSLPMQVANAKANAMSKISGAVQDVAAAIEANDVASNAADFQTEMAELNAAAKNRKSYTVKELDSLGIKYGNQYGPDKLTSVPAYMVSGKVYRKLSSKVFKTHSGNASRKGRAVIAKMYGQMYEEGISVVMANTFREAQSARTVAVESDFDAAVSSGNSNAAQIIAGTALATGFWDNAKYFAKTKKMPNNIARNQYLNNLNNVDDPNTLEVFLDSALIDPRLEPASKNSLYKNYEAKIRTLRKEEDKLVKEDKKQTSYEDFVGTATDILDSGEPMEWGALNNLALGMEPTDGKGLITLNRMMANKGGTTDPKVHMGLVAKVKTLSLPSEGTTVSQRRESIVNDLLRAAGVDPATGNQVGPAKISPQDFASLWDQINKSQSFAYDNPEVKRVADFIWTTLTGGSKDMMTRFFGTGPDTINATKAEADMLAAARNVGPSFDPDSWWSKNGLKYVTSAVEDNEKTMIENRLDKFIIRDFNSPGGIDIDKTSKAIHDRVKSKQMDKHDADRAIRDIYRLQQIRIKKMDLINSTKGEK